MTIINWNSGRPTESLAFFDRLGCRQILAGYYGRRSREHPGTGYRKPKRRHRVTGVMYTTWTNNYEHLEAFAAAAWGQK